jgi:predicted aspartyl protease
VITGVVQVGRQAVIRVRVKGSGGRSLEVEAVLDTGFTEALCLPEVTILSLGLRFLSIDTVILADGSHLTVTLYRGTVVWDGQDRSVVVHCMEGDPLIGMSLIYDHLLMMEGRDHGPVTLTALP